MPVQLTLSSLGSTVTVVPNDQKMTAKQGVVMNGSVIEIENVFAGTDPIPAVPYSFDFWIYSSKNQNSAQDAGPWSVTTFLKIQGVNYVIDSGSSDVSFTA